MEALEALANVMLVLAAAGYAVTTASGIGLLVVGGGRMPRLGRWALVVGILFHLGYLVIRVHDGLLRIFVDTGERLLVITLAAAVGQLILDRTFRTHVLTAFAGPVVLTLFAAGALSRSGGAPREDVATLLGVLHVGSGSLAFAAFVLSFGAAVGFLLQDRAIKRRRASRLLRRLPPIEILDRILIGGLLFGLPLLTLTLVLGAIWQRQSDILGADWPSDPKVIGGAVTWVIYAGLLQARLAGLIHGRRIAFLSILAFLVGIFMLLHTRHQL